MHDVSNSHQGSPHEGPGFFKFCRAKASGGAVHVTLCLTERAGTCPYRIPLRKDYVCRHPDQRAIIAQTSRDAAKSGNGAPVEKKETLLLLTWNPPAIAASLELEDIIYLLETDLITIGRSPANALVITDSSVSWHHAELTRTPAGIHIRDLNSSNGTFINGNRIAEKTLLTTGDTLRFGSSPDCKYACAPAPSQKPV